MTPAPIVLFVYNRLPHTLRTLEALRRNPLARDSELTIFSDGPKRESAAPQVAELRAALRNVQGFKRVSLVEREKNMGLANSIVTGVTEMVNRHGRVIVLEDDMVTSPHFLAYMNGALDLYADDENVISVAAYIFPVRRTLPDSFFLKGADCWGWATWLRGWSHYEPDGRKLLAQLESRRLMRAFDMDGSYPYTRMLRDQIAGKNDSWAVRWYAAAFLKDKLTLYPGVSMLKNIGNDGDGTHSTKTDVFDVELALKPAALMRLAAAENQEARRAVRDYFHRTRNTLPALFRRAWRKLRKR